MESKTKFMGHPVHPMLIVFPLGLFVTSVIFDILYLITGNTLYPTVAYYNEIAGIIGGLIAALFGFRDWLAVPSGSRAKRIGAFHGVGNVVIVVLFLLSWLMRMNSTGFIPSTLAFALTLIAVFIATITGWLGGELVDRLGVGVDPGANVDATSSLSGQRLGLDMSGAVPVTGESKYREKHIQKGLNGDPDVLTPHQVGDGSEGDVGSPVEPDNMD